MSRINPDRVHTIGLPLSNGRKPKRDEDDKYEPVDRYGKTEHEKWLESSRKR